MDSTCVSDSSDFSGETQALEEAHVLPGEIEFKPAQTMACTGGIGVMIVMPAFPERKDRDPPAIAGQIRAIKIAIPESMGG